jgi:hypothetical protein
MFVVMYEDTHSNDYSVGYNGLYCGVFETEELANNWINELCNFSIESKIPLIDNFIIYESNLNQKVL